MGDGVVGLARELEQCSEQHRNQDAKRGCAKLTTSAIFGGNTMLTNGVLVATLMSAMSGKLALTSLLRATIETAIERRRGFRKI
jgi:hypothetical protein